MKGKKFMGVEVSGKKKVEMLSTRSVKGKQRVSVRVVIITRYEYLSPMNYL